jgi:hypothetical protein
MGSAAYYRERASEYRAQARDADPVTARALIELAEAYEAEARAQEPDAEPPLPAA